MIIISFLILSLFTSQANRFLQVSVNGSAFSSDPVAFMLVGDSVTIQSEVAGYWVAWEPHLKEYDNLAQGAHHIEPIQYSKKFLTGSVSTSMIKLSFKNPGTYMIGLTDTLDGDIRSSKPIHLSEKEIVQLVVREDNSYTGFLTELLNLPFVIPPKSIAGYGHQTDLHVGTDCAALAVYGMRRMGFRIPYCGPRNITKYLIETTNVNRGTIVHFGFQVSVVYEDRGRKGKLDDEDIMIHAFEDRVRIQKLSETELKNMPYKTYRWKYLNTVSRSKIKSKQK